MIDLIIYCVFTYLYEFGFSYARGEFPVLSILFAPIMMPLELGAGIGVLLRNSKYGR